MLRDLTNSQYSGEVPLSSHSYSNSSFFRITDGHDIAGVQVTMSEDNAMIFTEHGFDEFDIWFQARSTIPREKELVEL